MAVNAWPVSSCRSRAIRCRSDSCAATIRRNSSPRSISRCWDLLSRAGLQIGDLLFGLHLEGVQEADHVDGGHACQCGPQQLHRKTQEPQEESLIDEVRRRQS